MNLRSTRGGSPGPANGTRSAAAKRWAALRFDLVQSAQHGQTTSRSSKASAVQTEKGALRVEHSWLWRQCQTRHVCFLAALLLAGGPWQKQLARLSTARSA